jgi:hypothetical protein
MMRVVNRLGASDGVEELWGEKASDAQESRAGDQSNNSKWTAGL